MQAYDKDATPIKFAYINADAPELARRGLAMYYQLLNGLDIPQKFHEAAVALLVAHRWEYSSSFQELTMMKLARTITTLNGGSHQKAYNRLKQNVPDFIDFLIENEIDLFEIEKGEGTRDANKYKFNYAKELNEIVSLPLDTPEKWIRERTDRLVMKIRGKRVDVQPRKRREKKPEDPIGLVAKALDEAAGMNKTEADIAVEISEKLELVGANKSRVRQILKDLVAIC